MEQPESCRAWLESHDGLKVPLLAYCITSDTGHPKIRSAAPFQ
jgi:hypothetical protein